MAEGIKLCKERVVPQNVAFDCLYAVIVGSPPKMKHKIIDNYSSIGYNTKVKLNHFDNLDWIREIHFYTKVQIEQLTFDTARAYIGLSGVERITIPFDGSHECKNRILSVFRRYEMLRHDREVCFSSSLPVAVALRQFLQPSSAHILDHISLSYIYGSIATCSGQPQDYEPDDRNKLTKRMVDLEIGQYHQYVERPIEKDIKTEMYLEVDRLVDSYLRRCEIWGQVPSVIGARYWILNNIRSNEFSDGVREQFELIKERRDSEEFEGHMGGFTKNDYCVENKIKLINPQNIDDIRRQVVAHFGVSYGVLRKHIEPVFDRYVLDEALEITYLRAIDYIMARFTPMQLLTLAYIDDFEADSREFNGHMFSPSSWLDHVADRKDVQETLSNVNTAASDISMAAETMATHSASISTDIKDIKVKAIGVLDMITAYLKKMFPQLAYNLLDYAILAFDFFRAFSHNCIATLTSCIMRVLAKLGLGSDLITEFLEWSGLYKTKKDEFVANGLSGTDFTAITVALMGVGVLKKMPSFADIRNVTDMCRAFNVLVPSCKNLTSFAEKLPEFLPNCVNAWIGYICPAYAWKTFLGGGFRDFHEAVIQMSHPEIENKIKYDPVLQKRLENLRSQATQYILEADKMKSVSPMLLHYFYKDTDKLDKLYDIYAAAQGTRGFRKTPFVICIFGPPNTGKSLSSLFLAYLLRPAGMGLENMVYARSPTDPFWSGYTGQNTVIVDDMNAFGDDEMTREFLTCISNVPMLLNMASLNDPKIGVKGTAFKSDNVIYTTNVPFARPDNMKVHQALWRRRDIMVELTVKPEYLKKNGQPNYESMPDDVSKNLTYMRWRLHDPLVEDDNAWLTDYMETPDFFRYCRRVAKKHYDNQCTMLQKMHLNPVVENIRAETKEYDINFEGHMFNASVINQDGLDDETFEEALGELHSLKDTDGASNLAAVLAHVPPGEMTVNPYTKEMRAKTMVGDYLTEIHARKVKGEVNACTEHFNKKECVTCASGDKCGSLTCLLDQRMKDKGVHQSWWNQITSDIEKKWTAFSIEHPWVATIIKYTSYAAAIATAIYGFIRLVVSDMESSEKRYERWNLYKIGVLPNEENAELCPWCKNPKCVVGGDMCWNTRRSLELNITPRHLERVEGHAAAGKAYDIGQRNAINRKFLRAPPGFQGHMKDKFMELVSENKNVGGEAFVENAVVPQLAIFRVIIKDGVDRFVNAFRFANRMCLIPKHIICDFEGNYLPEGHPIRIYLHGGTIFELAFSITDVNLLEPIEGRERDVVVYCLGPRVPAARDRIDHFIKYEDIGIIENKPGCLIGARFADDKDQTPFLKQFCFDSMFLDETRQPEAYTFGPSTNEMRKRYVIAHAIWYRALTSVGDCGALTISMAVKAEGKRLCGIHVAGKQSTLESISEPVYYEDLIKFRHYANQSDGHEPITFVLDENPHTFHAHGNFEVLGRVPPKLQMRLPMKSCIRESPLYGCFGPATTGVSVLSPKDPRIIHLGPNYSPVTNGIEKYAKQSAPFSTKYCELIYDYLVDEIATPFPGKKPFILTEHEMINGIPDMPYYDSLVMSTSCGFPFKRMGYKDKRDLFDGELPNAKMKKELADRFFEREEKAKRGVIIADSVCCVNTKDERRPLAKIQEGKTRIFQTLDATYTLLARKYFMSWYAHLYSMYPRSFSAVGMDCESMDWHHMCIQLLSKSKYGFAGDFGRFDGTLAPQFVEMFGILANDYYNDEFALVRNTLIEEMIHPQHMCMDAVYTVHGGNPSGNPATVLLNTVVNFCYLAMAWLELAPPGFKTMLSFEKYVFAKIYGDDNIIAVDTIALPFYNMVTVQNYFASKGLEYTPPDKAKGALDWKFDKIENFSFLKRKMVRLPEVSSCLWFAGIDKEVIEEMVYWYRKNEYTKEQNVEMNVNTALRFAFFHGREYFNFIKLTIKNTLAAVKPPFTIRYHNFSELAEQWNQIGKIAGIEDINKMELEFEGHMSEVAGVGGVAESQVETNLGVTHLEQQAPISQTVAEGAPANSGRRAESGMPDINWEICDMVDKEAPFAQLDWNTTQVVGTNIAAWNCPFDVLGNNTISLAFRNFMYWRGGMEVTARLNGNAMQQGRLILYFVPGKTVATAQTWQRANFAAKTCCPHILLDPTMNIPGRLKIPFINQNNFINIAAPGVTDFTGALMLDVQMVLQTGPGASADVDVTLFSRFPKAMRQAFHVPRPITYVPSRYVDLIAKIPKIVDVKDRRKTREQLLKEVMERFDREYEFIEEDESFEGHMGSSSSKGGDTDQSKSNSQSSTTSIEERNVGNTYNISFGSQMERMWRMQTTHEKDPFRDMVGGPAFGNQSNGGDSEGSGGDSTASTTTSTDASATIPTMDKPHSSVLVPALKKGVGYLNHAKGIEWLDRFSLLPNSQNPADNEHFGIGRDEMRLSYLWQKLTYKGNFGNIVSAPTTINPLTQSVGNWSSTQVVSTILQSGFICPFEESFGIQCANKNSDPDFYNYMPTVSYFSLDFNFWRGGFIFHFDFASTAFHSGRLAFAIHYGIFTVPTDLASTSDQFITYFDLTAQNKSFTVAIPYIDTISFRRVPNGPETDLNTVAAGCWSLRIVNQLKVSGTVANNVDYVTYFGADKDYHCWGMFGNNKTLVTCEGHMGEVATQPTMPVQEQKIPDARMQTAGHSEEQRYHFGEQYHSIQDILRVYRPFESANDNVFVGAPPGDLVTESANAYYPYPLFICPVQMPLHSGMFARYATCYSFWRGSIRFKFISTLTERPKTAGTTTYQPDSAIRSVVMYDRSSRWANITNGGQWEYVQATIAQYFCNKFFPTTGTQNTVGQRGYTTAFNKDIFPFYNAISGTGGNTVPCSISHTTMPISIADRYASDHTIEIPYNSEYPVLRMWDAPPATITDEAIYNPGYIYFGILTDAVNYAATPTGYSGGVVAMAAASDDWRCGVFVGHHAVVALGVITPGSGGLYVPLTPDKYPND